MIPVLTRLHPFAQPFLVLAVLVVVGCVDEVAAVFEEVVEYSDRGFLAAFTQFLGPCLAKIQCTEAEWGDSHACCGSEDSLIAKKTLGLGEGGIGGHRNGS